VTVRRVRLYDRPEHASVDAIVNRVAKALGPKTRCVAVTWVHSSSGVKLPLRELGQAVAHANRGRRSRERILLCVDGVHGFGVEDASPVGLDVDVFMSGCHKWLFGPRGTGVLLAAAHAWPRLAPTIPWFDRRAYGAWLDVYDDLGGRARVARKTHALARRLKEGLSAVRGGRVKTPMGEALSSGLVCAEVAGQRPDRVVERLLRKHRVVASITPYATEYVRFGPSVANDEADVDRAVEAVAAVSRS